MATTQQPHVRCPLSTRDLLRAFMFASVPTAGVGLWNLGHQTLSAAYGLNIDATASWPGNLIQILGITPAPDAILPCTLYGLLHVLPLLITVLAVAYGWERIIAKLRKRAMDPSWYMTAWLLVLLLPPATPVLLAAIAAPLPRSLAPTYLAARGAILLAPRYWGCCFCTSAILALSPPRYPCLTSSSPPAGRRQQCKGPMHCRSAPRCSAQSSAPWAPRPRPLACWGSST